MRVLVDASAAGHGGAADARLRELARELPRRAPQHDVTFVVRPRLRAETAGIAAGSALVMSPPPVFGAAPARVAWQLGRLPDRARALAPDVVLSLFNVVSPRWPSPRPRLAVMISNLAPFSNEVRRRSPLRARPRDVLLRRLTRSAVRRADLVIFQSRFGFETVAADCAPARHVVIPHAPPAIDAIGPSPLSPARGRYVAVVANRYPYKGVETVLEAVARIAAPARPRVALVGARSDARYAARLDRLVERLALREQVVDVGPLRHDAALGLIGDASACVACSRFENLSRIPYEAMALDTPLIASDIPAHREAAGSAALYYDAGDPEALARALTRVLSDDGPRPRLIAAGRERTDRARRADPIGALIASLEELAGAPGRALTRGRATAGVAP